MDVLNPNIRYDIIELLERTSPNTISVTKINYKECWGKIENNFIFITTYNGEGNSFTTKIHDLALVTAIKTNYNNNR